MPVYKVKYLAPDGSSGAVKVAARDKEAAAASVMAEGKVPLSAWWDTDSLRGSRLKADETAQVLEDLAWLLESGVDLRAALEVCMEQAPSERARGALGEAARMLERGLPLPEAMGSAGILGKDAEGIMAAAVEAGELAPTMKEYAADLRRRRKAAAEMKTRLIYPAVSLAAATAAAGVMFAYLLPLVAGFLPEEKLPATTRAVMAISAALAGYWFLVPPALAALAALAAAAYRRNREKVLAAAAGIGPLKTIIRGRLFGRFLSSLGLLLANRVPLTRALRLAAGEDPYLVRFAERAAARLERGGNLEDAAAEEPLLGRPAAAALAAARESGNLAERCRRMGRQYTDAARVASERLGEAVQPAVLLVAGGILALAFLGVYMPLLAGLGGLGR